MANGKTGASDSGSIEACETRVLGTMSALEGGTARPSELLTREVRIHVPKRRHALPAAATRLGGDGGDRFELIELLGSGAMGAVFLARDHLLERTVAVKFIHHLGDGASHDEVVALFRQEARATARLNHESIVRVFDLGTYEGKPFLVMEHLEGQSLQSMMDGGGFDALAATRIVADVARGLAHAHRAGIVHRDLKPSNVFMLRDGRAKILDFGLATILVGHGATSSTSVAGTPLFMSPEQWRGESLDGRTDLWSAGVMLFELLTGRLPIDARELHEIRDRVLGDAPLPSVRDLRPELPVEAEQILARALAKDAARRFGSADELLDALVALEVALGRNLRVASHAAPEAEARRRPTPRPMTLVSFGLGPLDVLAETLDADGFGELLAGFFDVAQTVVRQLEGTVVTAAGGRVLAAFGHPVAHEDDAQRAVRAGLLVLEGARGLASPRDAPHEVRVGVHTGPVIVGLGEPAAEATLLAGEAPDRALRLEQAAPPGAIAVSPRTAERVAWLFELSPLAPGAPDARGTDAAAAIEGFRVVAQRQVASRFEKAAGSSLTPLVGRDAELSTLAAAWERAVLGKGQLVLVSGEAGIGKSRLVDALEERVAAAQGATLTAQCWPYFKNAAFHPIVELTERTLGLLPDDDPSMRLAKLEALLERLGLDRREHVPVLAGLVSIPLGPLGGAYKPANLSPDLLKIRLFESLSAVLLALAAERPTLLLVEDVHWSDASTQELLESLLDRVASARLCVLLTSRPEYQRAWPTRAHLHSVTLARLPPSATAELVSHCARGLALPDDVVARLLSRADGVPLFVEELTRMLVDARRGAADGEPATLSIPGTLHELLLARLDRLGGAGKEVAQVGAVLGREFSFRLVERAAAVDGERLRSGLMQLVEGGLLRPEEQGGVARYVFKHALVQEAAYRSLGKRERTELHGRAADALSRHFPDVAEQQPELLAHHFAEAGAAESALPYLEKAGQRAAQRSAHIDAITHFQRALDLLATQPEGAARVRRELSLRLSLGSPLMARLGYANAEVEANYARALELCRRAGDDSQLFPATLGLWQFSMVGGRLPASVDLGRQLLSQAEASRDATSEMLARRALGTSLLLVGDLAGARDQTTRGLALYDRARHGPLAFRFGHDFGVAHGLYRGWALWLLGFADEAIEASRAALALARELDHPMSIVFAECYLGIVLNLRGEHAAAHAHAEDARRVATEHGLALWAAMSRIVGGSGLVGAGDTDAGVASLTDGIAGWMKTGARAGVTFFNAALALSLARAGRLDESLRAVDGGMALEEENGEFFFRPELLRLRGEALLALGDAHGGEACLRAAVERARAHDSRGLGLRAATSLARHLERTGRVAEARATLDPALGWFTQGFGTADLAVASSLADALRGDA